MTDEKILDKCVFVTGLRDPASIKEICPLFALISGITGDRDLPYSADCVW